MIVGLHLVACAFLISRAAAAEQKPNYYTLCFWDGFSRWRPEPYNSAVGDIPAELCNAVVYSHVTIDEKRSSIRLTDMELQLDPEAKSYSNSWIYNPIWLLPPNKIFAQMRDLKRRNSKLKLLLAVGGPHDPVEKYWQLFPQVYVWKDITASLIQWLRTYDFDGVVLDFFSGTASLHDTARSWDNAKFIHPFVRQINRDLMAEKESWSITFTLPAFDSTTHHLFDIEKLTMEVNFFLVKTSDCLEFPKCSLLNVTRTMDMTDIDRAELVVMKGAPRQRIVLEIPLSGRTYTATAATSGVHTVFPGHSGPYTKLQGFLAFFEVCSHIKSGWTRERFGEEACSFLKLADQYVAYEDAESVSRKARMVMGRQYRGAAIRSVDLGDYNGMCSEKSHLVKAIRSTLDISNYYVHFYYDPPNTTWWKEVKGKNSATQLPSTSTPSSEPTRTPLPTGSATQGPPKGTPASSNPHTPFVPFVPSAEEEQTTATKTTPEASTHAASSPEGTWTALSTPNAQSTLTQAAQPTAPPTVATDKGTDPQSATTPSASPGLLDRLLDQFGRFLQGGAGDVSPASPTTPSHSPTTKAETSPASPTTPSTSPGLFNRLLDQFGRFLQGGASDVSPAPPTTQAHSPTTKAEMSSALPTTPSASPGLFNRLLDQFGRFLQGGASDVSPAPPTTQAHSPTTKAETSSSSPTAPSTSPGLFGRLLDQFGRFLQGGAGTVSPAPSTTPSHTPATKVETSSAPPATPSASPGLFDRLLDQFGRLLQGGAGAVSSATPAAVSDFPTTKVEASSVLPVTLSVPTTSEVQTSSGHSFKATDPPTAEVPMSSAQPTTPSVSTTAKVPVSDRRILPSVPPTTKVVAPSVPSTLEVETSSAQPVASAQPPTPNIVASSVQYMSSSVPPTSKVMTPSAQPMTPSAPSTLTDETSSTQPAASSPTTTFDAVASTAQPMTSSVPLTPEVGTSSAHPTTASVPPTPKYPISSIKPMVTSLPPTSKGETSSAQPTTSSQYPTTQVVTSSGPRTTPSESQTPERTTASAPPAPPTTPTYRPAPAVPPATKSEGNICKGVQNNKLLPHESDCTRYYQCVHSTPFLRTCAQGTIFDIRRQTCNWPALANRPECI